MWSSHLTTMTTLLHAPLRSLLHLLCIGMMLFATAQGWAQQPAERRIALIVGNSEYKSVPKLDNPDQMRG